MSKRPVVASTESNKTLIVFPRGSLDPKTKELLSKNGYLGIEADSPHDVVTVFPMAGLVANLSGDEIVKAMVTTLNDNDSRRQGFGKALLDILASKP